MKQKLLASRPDRSLLLAIILYSCGILYYASRQREEFPFLLYGMYSLKELPQNTYTTYSIKINGKDVNNGSRSIREDLVNTIVSHYADAVENHLLTTNQEEEFKEWLLRYCLDSYGNSDGQIEIYRELYAYDSYATPHHLQTELIFKHEGGK